jgi:phenylalanyl-tRNA synthetase beta chain
MVEGEHAMRTTLLPSLLRAAARNQSRRVDDVALFEIARVYEPTDELLARERLTLSAVFSGARTQPGWNQPERRWDFFSVKGLIHGLFDGVGVEAPTYARIEASPFHPTRAAALSLENAALGVIGELHPDVCERFDVAGATVAFELSLDPVFRALPKRPQVTQPPRHPATFMDLAVVVADSVPAGAVRDAIVEAGSPEVVGVRLFDVYRGEQVDAGHKSLAFALELRAANRTMTDEEATAVRDRIVPALAGLGGRLRA